MADPMLRPIMSIISLWRNDNKAKPSMSCSMNTGPSIEQLGNCDTKEATSSRLQFIGFFSAANILTGRNGFKRSIHWSRISVKALRLSSRKLADTCRRRNISTSLLDMAANSVGLSVGWRDTCAFSKAGFAGTFRDMPAPTLNALLTALCLRSNRFGRSVFSSVAQLFFSYGHSSSLVCVYVSGFFALPMPRHPRIPHEFSGEL